MGSKDPQSEIRDPKSTWLVSRLAALLYFPSMFRRKSLTKDVFALSLGFAVFWGLLACVSLCTLETALHEQERSTCGNTTADDDRAYRAQPIDDCCLCPDISSPAGTTQQRETGEQLVSLGSVTSPLLFDVGPAPIPSYRTCDLVDDSTPKINAPPLFLRVRSFRI